MRIPVCSGHLEMGTNLENQGSTPGLYWLVQSLPTPKVSLRFHCILNIWLKRQPRVNQLPKINDFVYFMLSTMLSVT